MSIIMVLDELTTWRGRQRIIIEYIKMTLPLISHWTFPSGKKSDFKTKQIKSIRGVI
jgi:hypothetical protein